MQCIFTTSDDEMAGVFRAAFPGSRLRELILERLAEDARAGDLILTLGAGSVSGAGALLLEALENRV